MQSMIKYAQGNAGKTHEFIFPKIKWKRRKSLWTHWKATLSQPIPGAKCRDRPTKIVGWGRRTWKGCLGDYWERHLATTHLMVKHRNSKPTTLPSLSSISSYKYFSEWNAFPFFSFIENLEAHFTSRMNFFTSGRPEAKAQNSRNPKYE